MNLGIKISTLASIALFSASASAVNFDEATAMGGAGLDLGGGMGGLFNVGELSVGTNTVQGTLDGSTDVGETDPFQFTVAAGTQVDSITLQFSNPLFLGVDPANPGAEEGDDKTYNYSIVVAGTMGMGIDTAIGSTGVPNAMGGGITDCTAMGCDLFVDGAPTDLATGMAAAANGGGANGGGANGGGGGGMGGANGGGAGGGGMGTPLILDFAANPANAGITLDFPLQAGDYDFLQTVLTLTGMTDGIETLGALATFDWLVEIQVSPVPLPAAAWLFVSALAGLFGFRKAFSSEAA